MSGDDFDDQQAELNDDVPLFHTYVIYTIEEGVFYVGIGDDARLRTTLTIPSRRKEPTPDCPAGMSRKFVEIERRQNAGQALIVEPVFSSTNRAEAEQCERDFIRCYGSILTNVTYKDRTYADGWLPPGMVWQQFPLKNCPECLRLYQMKLQAQHSWDAQRFKKHLNRATLIASQQIFWDRAGDYYRHTRCHAQVVPRGMPLGVELPPDVLFTAWLLENYPCVDLAEGGYNASEESR